MSRALAITELAGRWHPGVRARTTIVAMLVVAVALVVAGAGLIFVVHRSLVRSIDAAGALRAHDVAALVTADRLPSTVPSTGEQASVVQVVMTSGQVLASSGNITDEPPIATVMPTSAAVTTVTRTGLPIGNGGESFRVAALRVPRPQGDIVVYVATSLSGVNATVGAISALLALGLPCLVLLVGATTWISTGRTLGPVEAIRRRVAGIEGTDLRLRVPQPSGRDEIARLAATMNAMLDRLERAARSQRRFVGDASHELRSPLAALRAQTDVALAHPDRADWPAVVADVSAQAGHLSDLVADLLLLANADEHAAATDIDDVDLDDLVLAEVARLRVASAHQVTIQALQPARVRGSRVRLGRALRNIGDNAARHARSEITVSLSRDAGSAVIRVTDDGPGIPPAERARVFERFTRLDAARDRDGGGTGLGLAITREIAHAHRGEIAIVDPRPGNAGVSVVLRLPLADSRQPRARAERAAGSAN